MLKKNGKTSNNLTSKQRKYIDKLLKENEASLKDEEVRNSKIKRGTVAAAAALATLGVTNAEVFATQGAVSEINQTANGVAGSQSVTLDETNASEIESKSISASMSESESESESLSVSELESKSISESVSTSDSLSQSESVALESKSDTNTADVVTTISVETILKDIKSKLVLVDNPELPTEKIVDLENTKLKLTQDEKDFIQELLANDVFVDEKSLFDAINKDEASKKIAEGKVTEENLLAVYKDEVKPKEIAPEIATRTLGNVVSPEAITASLTEPAIGERALQATPVTEADKIARETTRTGNQLAPENQIYQTNWEKTLQNTNNYWALEPGQNVLGVSGSDPIDYWNLTYDGVYINDDGRLVIQASINERATVVSSVWLNYLLRMDPRLWDKIDWEKSYVTSTQNTLNATKNYNYFNDTNFEYTKSINVDPTLLTSGQFRSGTLYNWPMTFVFKEGVSLNDLNDNYYIQLRLTDSKFQRIYALAPKGTSKDYSFYTTSTVAPFASNIENIFLKGERTIDERNLVNKNPYIHQRGLNAEFEAYPEGFAESSNTAAINLMYHNMNRLPDNGEVEGKGVAFYQAFDSELLQYIKSNSYDATTKTFKNSQETIGKIYLRHGQSRELLTTTPIEIKAENINFSKDGSVAYVLVATSRFDDESTKAHKVIRVGGLEGTVYKGNDTYTVTSLYLDKNKIRDAFETRGIDYDAISVANGYLMENPLGYTIYEKSLTEDRVMTGTKNENNNVDNNDRSSLYISVSGLPKGNSSQVMFQVGEKDTLIRNQAGWRQANGKEDNAIQKIADRGNGLYEVPLVEGYTAKAGTAIRVYVSDIAETTQLDVRTALIKNAYGYNSSGIFFNMDADRRLRMHLTSRAIDAKDYPSIAQYQNQDSTKVELTYYRKGATTPTTVTFTPNGLKTFWRVSDATDISNINTVYGASGSDYYLNTANIDTLKGIKGTSYFADGKTITSTVTYEQLIKTDRYTDLTVLDNTDSISSININKSIYAPYQNIFTNDTTAEKVAVTELIGRTPGAVDTDSYIDPRVTPEDFMKDTTSIVGYVKYEGGSVRMLYYDKDPNKTPISGKATSQSNEYDDSGNLVGVDLKKQITQLDKETLKNKVGTTHDVWRYSIDLASTIQYKQLETSTEVAAPMPRLVKDMGILLNASDGSSLPSNWYQARVKTRIFFNPTVGKFEDISETGVKVVPDNINWYQDDNYVANGFTGDNVQAGTGDAFAANPVLQGKTFLGWVSKAGLEKLGITETNPYTNIADFNALKATPYSHVGARALTGTQVSNSPNGFYVMESKTPITTHEVVYAVWTTGVVFNANGGVFADNTVLKNDTDLSDGVQKPTDPTRDGYIFEGWSTVADSTSPDATDAVINASKGGETYYAVWRIEQQKPTVGPVEDVVVKENEAMSPVQIPTTNTEDGGTVSTTETPKGTTTNTTPGDSTTPASAAISGTPTEVGVTGVTVTATDKNGQTAEDFFTITVAKNEASESASASQSVVESNNQVANSVSASKSASMVASNLESSSIAASKSKSTSFENSLASGLDSAFGQNTEVKGSVSNSVSLSVSEFASKSASASVSDADSLSVSASNSASLSTSGSLSASTSASISQSRWTSDNASISTSLSTQASDLTSIYTSTSDSKSKLASQGGVATASDVEASTSALKSMASRSDSIFKAQESTSVSNSEVDYESNSAKNSESLRNSNEKVLSESASTSKSQSMSELTPVDLESISRSLSDSTSTSLSDSTSKSASESKEASKSLSTSLSDVVSQSDSRSASLSLSLSASASTSRSDSISDQDSFSKSESLSEEVVSNSKSESASKYEKDSLSTSASISERASNNSQKVNESDSRSLSESKSVSESASLSDSTSLSTSTSKSESASTSTSTRLSDSISESLSAEKSVKDSVSKEQLQSESVRNSESVSVSLSDSTSQSVVASESTSASTSKLNSQQGNVTESDAIVSASVSTSRSESEASRNSDSTKASESRSLSQSDSKSQSDSASDSRSESDSKVDLLSKSTFKSDSTSESVVESLSDSASTSKSTSLSDVVSQSDSRSASLSLSLSASASTSRSDSISDQDSFSKSESLSEEVVSNSKSESASKYEKDSLSTSASISERASNNSQKVNESDSRSLSESKSVSESASLSDSTSLSTSTSKSESASTSTSTRLSDSINESKSAEDSVKNSVSKEQSQSESARDSVSLSASDSISDSLRASVSASESESLSGSLSNSASTSDSLSTSTSRLNSEQGIVTVSDASVSESASLSRSESEASRNADSTSASISRSESEASRNSDSTKASESRSLSQSDSKSQSDSASDSRSESDSKVDLLSKSTFKSDSTSESVVESLSDSASTSKSTSLSDVVSQSDSRSASLSLSLSASASTSRSDSISDQDSFSKSESLSEEVVSNSKSESASKYEKDSLSTSASISERASNNSQKVNESDSRSLSESKSVSESASLSDSTSLSTSTSKSESASTSTSTRLSDSINESKSAEDSVKNSVSKEQSQSESARDSVSLSASDSISDSLRASVSASESESLSGSLSNSASTSDSLSTSTSRLNSEQGIVTVSDASVSESASLSRSESEASRNADSTSASISRSESEASRNSDSTKASESRSLSQSDSKSQSDSASDSRSESDSKVDSLSKSTFKSDSTSESVVESLSDSASTSKSTSLSDVVSQSDSRLQSLSNSLSTSESLSISLSESVSLSDSLSSSESLSNSVSASESLVAMISAISVSASESMSTSESMKLSESIKAENVDKKATNPRTGDTTNLFGMAKTLGASVLGLFLLGKKKRKDDEDSEEENK